MTEIRLHAATQFGLAGRICQQSPDAGGGLHDFPDPAFAVLELNGFHAGRTDVINHGPGPAPGFLADCHGVGTDLEGVIVDDCAASFAGSLELAHFFGIAQVDVADHRYLDVLQAEPDRLLVGQRTLPLAHYPAALLHAADYYGTFAPDRVFRVDLISLADEGVVFVCGKRADVVGIQGLSSGQHLPDGFVHRRATVHGRAALFADVIDQIKNAERWVGAKLVHRCSRQVLDTESGKRVVQVTTPVVAGGGSGYLNRARAIQDHYGDENVPLAIRPCPVNLLDPGADLPKLLAQIDMVKELYGDIALICVDTLSRSMVGGNENAPEAMTSIISSGDLLRSHADCSILFVHHSSKANDNAARGHSSLRAATDTEIEVAVDEVSGIRFAKTTKQREIEGGREFAFELETVILGDDEDGDNVTSCYVMPVTEDRKQEAKVKLSPSGKKMIECFTQLQGDHVGKINPGGTGYPEGGTRWMIEVEDLRKHFLGKTTATNKSQAFNRPFEKLVEDGQIAVNDGFCWLTAGKYKL